MTRFCSVEEVGHQLEISRDHVRNLIREKRLRAGKVGGEKGDYLIHPVDASRLQVVRSLSIGVQDSLKPDIIWIYEACKWLSSQVVESGFDPQCVLGVSYGGVVPASFVSVFLRRQLQTIGVTHYDGKIRRPLPVIIREPDFIPRVSVLVVDDIVDSGATLKEVQDFLDLKAVMDVRFAVLHKKPTSSFEPNWYVDIVTNWVYYPWGHEAEEVK